jgi:hypothetical protein
MAFEWVQKQNFDCQMATCHLQRQFRIILYVSTSKGARKMQNQQCQEVINS